MGVYKQPYFEVASLHPKNQWLFLVNHLSFVFIAILTKFGIFSVQCRGTSCLHHMNFQLVDELKLFGQCN